MGNSSSTTSDVLRKHHSANSTAWINAVLKLVAPSTLDEATSFAKEGALASELPGFLVQMEAYHHLYYQSLVDRMLPPMLYLKQTLAKYVSTGNPYVGLPVIGQARDMAMATSGTIFQKAAAYARQLLRMFYPSADETLAVFSKNIPDTNMKTYKLQVTERWAKALGMSGNTWYAYLSVSSNFLEKFLWVTQELRSYCLKDTTAPLPRTLALAERPEPRDYCEVPLCYLTDPVIKELLSCPENRRWFRWCLGLAHDTRLSEKNREKWEYSLQSQVSLWIERGVDVLEIVPFEHKLKPFES